MAADRVERQLGTLAGSIAALLALGLPPERIREEVEEALGPEHVLVWDGGGRYERLTCTVCGEQVVRKPYHTTAEWERLVHVFRADHPETA